MDTNIVQTTLIAGTELWRPALLFGLVAFGVIAAKLGRLLLNRSADTFERHGRVLMGSTMRALARSVAMISVAVVFPIAQIFISPGEVLESVILGIKSILITLAIGFTFYQLVDVVFVWMHQYSTRSQNKMNDMLVPIVRTSLRVTVVALTFLQIAQSLTDKPLTSIIAGLGVGGLAVALAAQDTIKHFFGSIVLFADKPFQVGERITVDTIDGTVEEVGFRSSRIRTLEGHLVTIPNGDLANKVITNIGLRPYIRHRSVINLTYDTSPEQVRRAIEIIQDLLKNHEGMNPEFPPKVVFDEFASSSLNLLIMFWYHPADFWMYKTFVDQLNFKILEQFNRESISFAFPSQTIYLSDDRKQST